MLCPHAYALPSLPTAKKTLLCILPDPIELLIWFNLPSLRLYGGAMVVVSSPGWLPLLGLMVQRGASMMFLVAGVLKL